MMFADLDEPPVPAWQNVAEFGHLWDHLAERGTSTVLEIGSLFGGTLWYWSRLPALRRCVTIDMPSDWSNVAAGVREARPSWAGFFPDADFLDLMESSHDPATVVTVDEWLNDGDAFDFAFIDGDHSYDGVKRDFELYRPMVRPGGLVAFHDTVPNADRHEPGVVAFVHELKWQFSSVEWFDPDGVGICAFYMPSR